MAETLLLISTTSVPEIAVAKLMFTEWIKAKKKGNNTPAL